MGIATDYGTDWLEGRSRLTPERIAVIDAETNERWTYAELNRRASKMAKFLQDQGIGKGDRIALLSPNHISYFDLLFACGKLGAIFVPMNWRLSSQELAYLMEDCTPNLLAYHGDLEGVVRDLLRGSTVLATLRVDQPSYEERFTVTHGEPSQVEVEVDDPLTIIYTGGTTGKSKGVVLTHRSVIWNGLNTILSWHLNDQDTTLTYLPMFHTGGLNALTLPILQIGGKVILGRQFHVDRAMDLLTEAGCTIVLMVPTMYQMLIGSPRFQRETFPTMHTFLSGGAPCPHSVYQAFADKGLSFKEGYGLTEAGPNNFYMDPDHVARKRGSVGKPMIFNQIKILHPNGGEAGPGEIGEIIIRGNHLFGYYWNNPEATQVTLADSWLRTGDLGKYDEEGYYYIVGRKKEMIITGGENVYPLEVEQIIAEHPAIHDVVVIGLPDQKWGEIVTAVVVLQKDGVLSEEELRAYCAERIARYKVPKKIFFLSELPKTSVGKINKQAIIQMFSKT